MTVYIRYIWWFLSVNFSQERLFHLWRRCEKWKSDIYIYIIDNRLEESRDMRPTCGLTLTAKWITWIESDSKESRRIGMRLYQFSLDYRGSLACLQGSLTYWVILRPTGSSCISRIYYWYKCNLQFERKLPPNLQFFEFTIYLKKKREKFIKIFFSKIYIHKGNIFKNFPFDNLLNIYLRILSS